MLLRHAKLFCEVVSRRSISEAARACDIAQPTASQAVSQIEEELGVQLLDRSNRPFRVTPAGEIYAAGCRDLLGQVSDLEDRVRAAGNRIAGEVRVSAIYSVGMLETRTIVEDFQAKHPAVSITLSHRHPSEVYDDLRSNKAELGLIAFPREGGEFESTMWQAHQMVAVVPPTHRFAVRKTLRIDELNGEPFVALTTGLKTRQHLDRVLKAHRVCVREVDQFDNFDTLRRAVCEGSGISIAPRAIYQADADSGLLALVAIDDPDGELIRPLGIVHRRHSRLSAAAKAFIDELLRRAPARDDTGSRKPRDADGIEALGDVTATEPVAASAMS